MCLWVCFVYMCMCVHVSTCTVCACPYAYMHITYVVSVCTCIYVPHKFIGCHLPLLRMYVCIYVCMHVHTVAASMLGQLPWVSAVTLGTCTSCVHVVNLHGWRTQAEGIKCSYFTVEMYCMNLLQEIEDWILYPAPCRPACNGRYST